jgi:hypothetical protein
MRKTPPDLTGPIDNIILIIISHIEFIFKTINFTPNILTTISFLFGLTSMYYFSHNRPISATTFYLLYYIFDCYDGYYARKYNMVTKFGDYYDHIKDVIINLLLFYIAFTKCTLNTTCLTLIIIGIILLSYTMSYIGCQEIYYNKPESASIESCKKLCPGKTKQQAATNLKNGLRYFSGGTTILYLTFLMNYLMYKQT